MHSSLLILNLDAAEAFLSPPPFACLLDKLYTDFIANESQEEKLSRNPFLKISNSFFLRIVVVNEALVTRVAARARPTPIRLKGKIKFDTNKIRQSLFTKF